MPLVILPAAVSQAAAFFCRRRIFALALVGASAVAAVFCLRSPAGAQESRTLIIPSNDGYGFDECLERGSPCGLVVADAWCKAHGFAGSQGFGPADENDTAAGSVHVTCGERLD